MKNKTKIFIGIGTFLILITVSAIGYGVYSIYSFFKEIGFRKEVPTELKETKVLLGAEFLRKTEIFKLEQQSLLETINDSSQIKDEKDRQRIIESQVARGIYNFADLKVIGNEIIAVGEFGGFVFDLSGNLKREIFFEPSKQKVKIVGYEKENYKSNLDNLQIVELEKGKPGFLSFGSMQGAIVFNENGNQIWTNGKEDVDLDVLFKDEKGRDADYEKRNNVLEATVGDLDNDGVSEYIISKKKEGIYAFTRDNVQKWFQPDDFASHKLKVVDLDKDNKNELVEIGSKIRNGADGKLLREIKGYDSNALLLTEGKDKKKSLLLCDFRENKLECKDETDKIVITGNAPLSEIKIATQPEKDLPKPTAIYDPENPNVRAEPVTHSSYDDKSERVYEPKAGWVSLKKDKPKYLAIIASFIGIPRSNFYVYDEKGTLIYHELLPEDAETIAVLPSQNGTEEILVGGKDTIWKFSAN